MSDADQIIKDLRMAAHPEGGHFIECLRTNDVSIIYYLLKKNEKSHWHRLTKNETLHFYKGDPLTIFTSKDGDSFSSLNIGEKNNFNFTINAGTWFAMKSNGEYSLIGCAVAPPFDYNDFELAPANWKPTKFNQYL